VAGRLNFKGRRGGGKELLGGGGGGKKYQESIIAVRFTNKTLYQLKANRTASESRTINVTIKDGRRELPPPVHEALGGQREDVHPARVCADATGNGEITGRRIGVTKKWGRRKARREEGGEGV